MRQIICATLLLASACATPARESAEAEPAAPEKAAEAESLAPIADHHIHLYSPADVELETPAVLPAIALPGPIARLVAERERQWDDVAALAELYTKDALFYSPGNIGWVQGAATAARHANWNISIYPYNVKATRYVADGRSARVAGYYTRPLSDGSIRHFGYFLYALIQQADGAWRIAAETYIYQPVRFGEVRTAKDVVADMDRMGVRFGAVMSNAYYFDAVRLDPPADPYPKVRAENDWTAEQIRPFAGRLFGFCSFNPLKDYARAELDRCVSSGAFKGLKLHFNGAQLNFRDTAQLARVKAIMWAANAHRLPMVIHVRPGNVYGREEAEIFLNQLVSAAPDVPIQIAHLWGGETFSPDALAVYADAVASGNPVARNLFFDVSGTWSYSKPEDMTEIVRRMRQIGLSRLLYASDAPPDEAWQALRAQVPLTASELKAIASNVAPYFR